MTAPDLDVTDIPFHDGFGSVLRARLRRDADGNMIGVEIREGDSGMPGDDDHYTQYLPLSVLGQLGSWVRTRFSEAEKDG
jgi:hypothetical protein